jgi:hypothetical protein
MLPPRLLVPIQVASLLVTAVTLAAVAQLGAPPASAQGDWMLTAGHHPSGPQWRQLKRTP